MRTINLKRWGQITLIVMATAFLSGCVYWRLLQTKLQLNDFDQYFSIVLEEGFTWHFKKPLMYSDDFIFLSKFQPTLKQEIQHGYRWRYWFRKVDSNQHYIKPEVKYYFDLDFNKEHKLTDWTLSSLFLNMAPAEFLAVSLRSLGKGAVNKSKRQVKVDAAFMEKTDAKLPVKYEITAQLGEPLEKMLEDNLSIYRYHFLLSTDEIESGYEDRALTVVNLYFDNNTEQLVKIKGRIVGVKLSVDYRKYMEKEEDNKT